MKTLFIFFIISTLFLSGFAQPDTTTVKVFEKKIVEVTEDDDNTKVEVGNSTVEVSEGVDSDTVQIRLGNHNVEISTNENKTHIDVEKIDDFDSKWNNNQWDIDEYKTVGKHRRKSFDGHWAGIDFGGNQLWKTDYSMYPEGTPAFLETRPEKSFEFNLNFAEYSFGFGSYIGIVTGLGLNFNDYKFKNRTTITKDENGVIQPLELPEGDFRKSKLSTGYLTAPLLLEIQIPGNGGRDRLFISGGVIGGLKIGEHTKTKVGKEKTKDKSDHNVSPLRWGYTARIGFENMGVYATYYNTNLFEKDKGPETTPLTLGLVFTFD